MIYFNLDREESYRRLTETLKNKDFREVTPYNPLMLAFEITTCCNFRCIRCERHSINPEHLNHHMTEETFERLSVLFPYVRGISVVGGLGEPLLCPNFWNYISKMKSYGCQVQYFTNASKCSDDVIKKSFSMGIDVVVFSMDSIVPEVYEHFKQGGSFIHLMDRIKSFIKLRKETSAHTKLMINCAIQKDTIDGMIPLLRFAVKYEIDKVWFTGVITHIQDEVPNSHLQLSLSELEEKLSKVSEEAERLGIDIRLPATSLTSKQICKDLWTNLYIFYNGDICACPHFREKKTYYYHVKNGKIINEPRELPDTILGNVYEVDPLTLWDGPKHREMRRKMLEGTPDFPCRECHFSYELH